MTDSDDDRPPLPSDLTTAFPDSKGGALPSAGRPTPLPGSHRSLLPGTDQPTTGLPAGDGSFTEPSSRSGGRGEALPTFSSNQLISGRYKVVRFVARGGMGEVYEAEDLELRTHVALKTVRAGLADEPGTLEQFKREIFLARRISHPNVCRIFDLGRHQSGAGEVLFLTMEMLAGETLAERLERVGRMSPAEALPILRQMAAGLEAAHAQGIVHRDFKSGNVILAAGSAGPAGDATAAPLRAVVTDFGLARGIAASDDFASQSQAGIVVGTPAYMAPEQVEGEKLGPAADIYALGVVLYEMVTGRLPFAGESSLSVAVKRLKEPAPSPRLHVPDLAPRWEAAILRCLERDPADRFANAGDVARAIGGEEVAAGRKEKRLFRQRLTTAGAVILVILAALVVRNIRVSRKLEKATRAAATATLPSLPAAPNTLRRSIAVLGFRNLSGKPDFAWLSTALSEMFGSELAAGEKLRVVSGEEVARMKIDLALAEADSLAPDTLGRIRAHSHSDFVVLGSFLATGTGSSGRIRLDIKVQDTSGQRVTASFIGNGTEAEISKLVSDTAARLREKLDLGKVLPADAMAIKATLPSGTEALRLYSEGLAKLRSFDALAAKDLLERAVAADPNHGLSRSALASAWSSLGYDQRAKDEAKKAFDLAANLPREDRLLVQGLYHEAMKKWDDAIETYRTLWTFAPDNLDYGLRLAAAETSGGKGRDALLVTEALRKLPPPAQGDPRIDLEEAAAAQALGDSKQALAAARRAAAKGEKNALRLVVARAQILEGGASRNLGELAKARIAAEEAQRIYAASGDKGGVARALNNIALVLWDQGDLAGAKRMHEEALAIRREIGNKNGVAASLNTIALVLRDQGDLAGAKRMYEEALAIRREIGDKSGVAMSLINIANVLYDRGDLAGAKRMYEESLATFREIGDKGGVAMSGGNVAIVLYDQGDLAGAKRMQEESLATFRKIGGKHAVAVSFINLANLSFEQADLAGAKKTAGEALALAREIGQKSLSAYALEALAIALEAEGDLPGAHTHHEEALGIRKTLGEQLTTAASRLALAELALEEGRSGEAMTAARQAASFFQTEKNSDSEASARAILARALLEMRNVAGAAKEITGAESLMQKSQKAMVRAAIGVTSARVRAASGKAIDVAAARKSLESSLAEATQSGWAARAFEIRLALGEIEMHSDPAVGRARLAGLEKDARAKGFGLIAGKAAKLAASGAPSRSP